MRALRRFTVRPGLPEPLADLRTLATNLRWTWHPPTQELFAAVDPTVWSRVENDPLRLLSEVPADVLDRLAADEAFLAKVKAVAADLRHYLTGPRWYQQRSEDTASRRATATRSRRPVRSRTSPWSSASPRRCPTTPVASACSPATTSRPPPTSDSR